MLRRIPAILYVVFTVYCAMAAPQPRQKISDGERATQCPATDQRGTQYSPLVVNTRTVHTDEETAEEAKRDAEQKHLNAWTIGLTLAIAICAFLQFCAIVGQVIVYIRQSNIMDRQAHEMKRQRSYMRLQWKKMEEQATLMASQLQEMKESGEREAKTLILQYRPKIIIRNAKAFDFHVAELSKSANGKVEFTVVNIGGTNAKITEGNVFMMVAKSSKDTARGRDYPIPEFILQPGEDSTLTVNMDDITNDFRFVEFGEARGLGQIKSVYLCGKIRYFDDNSIPRSARFKRKYEPSEGRFIPEENPDEEYTD